MVTISRIRTKTAFLASIRGKILLAFFVIVGVSFAVAATSLTDLVSEFLFDQRTREDMLLTEKVADQVSPLYRSLSLEELNQSLTDNAGTMDGRLLVVDGDGKVQADTFQELCGERLLLHEVIAVLLSGETEAYGMYSPGREAAERMSGEGGAASVAYCVHEITGPDNSRGALVFVSRIQRLMDAMSGVRWRLVRVFILIAVAALILALFLSQVLTKPITSLSKTMRKMGKGDLSVRVPVQGSGELRELAENYNTMASQLESLDKTRSQFVSNASHELKTPLATMKIMIESLIYQPDMDKDLRTEFMTDINNEIDRLSAIVSDLLTLVQMDSQNVKLTRENLSIAQLIQENAHRLQPIAEQKGQKILLTLSDPCDIYADKSKLNQVIYNLMENAVKYTQNGGVIRVALQRQGRDARFTVSDNGPGIPKENLPHIFDRFYRVDKARSREKGGTGLGLSIVHQLILLHGGAISVESEEGKGATFIVELPLHQG